MRSSHILGEDEKAYEGASPDNNITSREYLYLQEPAKSLTQPFTGRHCIIKVSLLGTAVRAVTPDIASNIFDWTTTNCSVIAKRTN